MLIDSHCHLNEFSNIKKIIENAKKENVNLILSCAVDAESIHSHLKMQKEFKEVKIALGLHPSNSVYGMKNKAIEECIKLVEDSIGKALAVGEIGLDFKHADTEGKRKTQRKVFKSQLLIALENKKPVVVHSRRSHWACFKILEDFSPNPVLMHWFYDKKFLKHLIDLNFFASIGPSVFSDKRVQDFTKKIPLENLLLETDAPVKFNGESSEPAWIKKVALKVSQLKEIPLEELERACEKNFEAFARQKK